MLASEAHHSSILKNKQKSFKPGFFQTKSILIINTKKYLKSGVVMLNGRILGCRTPLLSSCQNCTQLYKKGYCKTTMGSPNIPAPYTPMQHLLSLDGLSRKEKPQCKVVW